MAGEPRTQLLILRLDGREFGLVVDRVLEVVRMVDITPVPEGPPWLEGMLNVRGRVAPVVDLRARLGIDRREPDLSTAIVIASSAGGIFGLIVDEAVELLALAPEPLDPAARDAGGASAVVALARHGERLVLVLDPDRLADRSLEALTIPSQRVAGNGAPS